MLKNEGGAGYIFNQRNNNLKRLEIFLSGYCF